MFDARIRPYIDPPLHQIARLCLAAGLNADRLTAIGFLCGVISALCIYLGVYYLAFLFFCLNRLADGLDGAVARLTQSSDRGGYFDIVADFLFFALIPFAFGAADPDMRLAALFLIFSFVGTGTSFLAYAIIAAKQNLTTDIRGKKSFFYLGGLTEGAETIFVLGLVILWPATFVPAAWIFGCLCWVTTATRCLSAWQDFTE